MGNIRPLRKNCITCDRPRGEEERFSWSGQCPECGYKRMVENMAAISTHSGEPFVHWRRRSVAAYGGVLLDDLHGED